jgi:hypothetical protein
MASFKMRFFKNPYPLVANAESEKKIGIQWLIDRNKNRLHPAQQLPQISETTAP